VTVSAGVGSSCSAETVTVFDTIVESERSQFTSATIVTVDEPPAPIDEMLTVRALPVPPHAPSPVTLQSIKVRFEGRKSATFT